MTLRGRLTTAFLAVVLGPVLLGSLFVGMTVATVSRDRTHERLEHAVTTLRTSVGALCRQLQALADSVAILPDADRQAAADQMVRRGLATTVTLGAAPGPGPYDCAGPAVASARGPAAADDPTGRGVPAIGARAQAGQTTIIAAQALDPWFLDRLASSIGARIALLGPADPRADRYARHLLPVPGQPLPLVVSVPADHLTGLYAILSGLDLLVAAGAVLVARWLARSTTRPLAGLAWAAGRVADGALDTRVPVGRNDEIGQLAGTFNRMTRELQSYVQALTASRDQLRNHLAILGDTLSSTHDLHKILQVILQTALAATGARGGVVLTVDPRDRSLVARVAEGLTGRWAVPEADLPKLRIPAGTGVLGAVAATGEPLRGFCVPGGPDLDEPPGRTFVAVPICAPVALGDPLAPGEPPAPPTSPAPATLGVLALYDRLGSDEFDDTDLLTLRTFAGQAGVAVHNVRMHEEAQRLSLTDPLTGLWNYRYLRESLRREVERASRFGRMLTVLVLDLDHFKEVNDTYGHAAGDAVLSEFARRLRTTLREVDVPFRQGGEEFVVLLPETDAFGGAIVAERLGAAIREDPVIVTSRRQAVDRIRVSVSIGIAVYPEHGVNAQQVLDAADEALYTAKDAGRDTYRLAEGVPERGADGHLDEATAAPGGPQPPRQGRGR